MTAFADEHIVPRYTPAQVAPAVGISIDNLNNWLRPDRRVITMSSLMPSPGGRGQQRLFTLRAVYQVALTAQLVRRGMDTQPASNAAALFAGLGDAHRNPGQLFKDGDTYLCIDRAIDESWLRNIVPNATFAQVLSCLSADGQRDWDFVDVGRVVGAVRRALGLNWQQPEDFDHFVEAPDVLGAAGEQVG